MSKTYALIGFSLIQSMSKEFFDEFFRVNNIEAHYQNIELNNIGEFVAVVQKNHFSGLNVTIPYKEKVIPYLDLLEGSAKDVGAVNVIKLQNSNLIGYNTDIYGFKMALLPLLQPHHKNALILGTGGASKAVKYVLDNLQINSKFVSRTKTESNFIYTELTAQIIENHQIIINTTPVGSVPNMELCPDLPYEFLTNRYLLFDLICKPNKTLFLQKGEISGATIENGLKMFNFQALEAYKIWNTKD
ncbi:MAG: shikimate dehydrogenase [Prevotellaceae bacterium]|jgi:shikimate dehydrogenase|nr:shikimate dehydrogenase [Prevotellaceae bacterium]